MGLERPTPLSLGFEPFGQIGDSELLQHVQSFLCRVFAALPVPNATKSQAVRGRRGPETTLTLTRRLDAWGGLHAVSAATSGHPALPFLDCSFSPK